MSQDQWTAVDQYITELFVPPDAALDAALQASTEAGLPPINVAQNQGKLLHILARSGGARPFWRSARSAATAPSGWHGRCPPAEN